VFVTDFSSHSYSDLAQLNTNLLTVSANLDFLGVSMKVAILTNAAEQYQECVVICRMGKREP
jgi:hypothetical protein